MSIRPTLFIDEENSPSSAEFSDENVAGHVYTRWCTISYLYSPPSLKEEYRQRYISRGNNDRFIFEVMFIWYPALIPLYLLSKILPKWITITQSGETLEDYRLKSFSIRKDCYHKGLVKGMVL